MAGAPATIAQVNCYSVYTGSYNFVVCDFETKVKDAAYYGARPFICLHEVRLWYEVGKLNSKHGRLPVVQLSKMDKVCIYVHDLGKHEQEGQRQN